jgi:4-diphosphocytidyl-2-C-methyl-D-erythritol kinase
MIHIKSHAKINLFLNIVGKRADGYHLLESFFTPISLADDMYITPASELTCEMMG